MTIVRTVVESSERPVGDVLVRGLVRRLSARNEAMPVQYALTIVIGAAIRVEAAHAARERLHACAETVLVRFDGAIEIAASGAVLPEGDGKRRPHDSTDVRADVAALGRLLAELLMGAEVPASLADAAAGAIDPDDTHTSARELAASLEIAARRAGVAADPEALGRWAKRQVHPPRYAHTMRREDSILGRIKPTKLAHGSGEHDVSEVHIDLDLEFPDPAERRVDDEVTVARRPSKVTRPIVPRRHPIALPLPAPADRSTPVRSAAAARGGRGLAVLAAIVAGLMIAAGAAALYLGQGAVRLRPAAAALGPATIAIVPPDAAEAARPVAITAPAKPDFAAATAAFAEARRIGDWDSAAAACLTLRASPSRKVRVSCAIAACKAGREGLRTELVESLDGPRRVQVARACKRRW